MPWGRGAIKTAISKVKICKKSNGLSSSRELSVEIFTILRSFEMLISKNTNRPRSIYQYSNMGPRLSGLTSIFGVVFFVSKSLLGIEGQKKL